MSLDAFYCLSNAVLLLLLLIYSTKYITSNIYKNYRIHKYLKNNLEKIYSLSSYKDSVHN